MAKQNKKIKPEQEIKEEPKVVSYPAPAPVVPYPTYLKIGDGLIELSSHYDDMNKLVGAANFILKKHKKLLLNKQKIEQAKKLMDYFG